MAKREELLISKSMIFRSVRAFNAISFGPSDFPGLIGMGMWGLVDTEDPLLKTLGRSVGI